MTALRHDIADAAARMRVTFGTRTAMKHLAHSLQSGELVREMVACTFAGSEGLLVLTDRRVLAVRDDYSSFRLRDCLITDITCLDYAPTVHDGLAAFTDESRVAVRKMNTEDSDRLVSRLMDVRPDLVVTALAPGSVVRPATRGRTGLPNPPVPGPPPVPAAASATAAAPVPPPATDPGAAPEVPTAATPPPFGMPYRPATGPEAERDVLIGVLADLHARGLLSSDELAEKISLLGDPAARPA